MSLCAPLRLGDLLLTKVLVQDVYRRLGVEHADRVFARIMDGDVDDSAVVEVTWGKLLKDALGVKDAMNWTATHGTGTVALLGASNYRYYVHIVACILSQRPVLLLSTRNSVSGMQSLLNDVNAVCIITDPPHAEIANELCRRAQRIYMCIQENIETEGKASPKSAHPTHVGAPMETFDDSDLDRVLAYTHTSGSEGHPKPVPITHRRFLSDVRAGTARKYAGSTLYSTAPLFHGMGLYAFTRWPIGSAIIPTFVESKGPPSGSAMARHLRRLPDAICFIPPMLLEDMVRDPSIDTSILTSCQRIFFGGAPIDPNAAETLIRRGAPLVCVFGSTELSIVSVLDFPSSDMQRDWSYFRFTDRYHYAQQ